MLPIFFDIDGTLTSVPTKMWGPVYPARIAAVQRLIASGREVILWSGGGTAYARAFAEKYDLPAAVCIGKPDMAIDDNPTIRPRLRIVSSGEFFD